MVQSEVIKTTVTQVAMQAATAVVMVMREASAGPISWPAWEKHRDKDMADQLTILQLECSRKLLELLNLSQKLQTYFKLRCIN